jgi:triphosphatase
MTHEIELKLAIAEKDVWRLLRLPLLATVTQKKFPAQRLVNTYYDTADYRMRELGIAIRLRQIGGKWLQTIKTEGRVIAGLHERFEWETQTTANTFDFSLLQDMELKSLLENSLDGEPLQPAFTTDFTRIKRILRFDDGTECEFALDRGKIIASGKEQLISEIELEIVAGDARRLFEFSKTLIEHIPIRLMHESKAARGFALSPGAQSKPTKAKQAALDKQMSARQGFVAIASACLQHMTANEAGCSLGEDVEYLHQMRVAIRRLRTAIRLFADFLDSEKMIAIVEELRWLGEELGMTRDLDVFLGETLPPMIASWPNDIGLARVGTRIFEQRAAAAAASRAAVQSPRYQQLLLNLALWLLALSEQGESTDEITKLADFARNALKRHRKQLIRRAENLLELSADERHRARISGKRLRYAAEFFSPLFPARKSKPYIQELANLQSILGVLNDAAMTHTILSQVTDESNGHAVTVIQAWVLGGAQGHLAHLAQAQQRFLRQPTFW